MLQGSFRFYVPSFLCLTGIRCVHVEGIVGHVCFVSCFSLALLGDKKSILASNCAHLLLCVSSLCCAIVNLFNMPNGNLLCTFT